MQQQVLIIGGGPAGLSAAEILSENGTCSVCVVDQMSSFGRKFLMAGRSGLNLTNAEALPQFLARYGAAEEWLAPSIHAYSPSDMRLWAENLGQTCFTGSSGRVFPESMKGSPLLRAWMRRLDERGVQFRYGITWRGWTSTGEVVLLPRHGAEEHRTPDVTILALGGGSWARLGSDGKWMEQLAAHHVPLAPFRPANCGFRIDWSPTFVERFAGTPLKRIALSFGEEKRRGEATVTQRGIEGGLVYALAARLRDAIEKEGKATVFVDLRPDLSETVMAEKLKRTRARESLSNRLRKAVQLPPVAISLLRESGPLPADADALARRLKSLPLVLTATDERDRAISTAGGVKREAVDDRFMLKDMPGVFVCGEMLDWEAPTGGYLMQAVMATGRAAGQGALAWLAQRRAVA